MANIKISELSPLLTVQDADVIPIVDNAITKKVTAEILRSYTQGNSVLLTGAQTVAGIKTFTSQLASSVATGTAPFSVASTTKVTNLNADLLDGLSSADFQATLSGTGIVKSTAGTISYLTDNSTNWNTAYNDSIVSAAVTGTTTKLLTLNQQDGGTITASWSDYDTAPVTSVFGRTGSVVAAEGDYSLTQLSDVSIGSPTNGQVLKYNGTAWVNGTDLNSGTVTSVGLTSSTSGVTIGASPVTTSGNITLAIATATGSQNGLLSSTDWTTFNGKQNALTNPITGTGTTNYLPKFTGASALGNSSIFDDGNIGIGTITPSQKLEVSGGSIIASGFGNRAVGTGKALELGMDGSYGIIQAIDRTGLVNIPIYMSGSATYIMNGNVGIGTTSPAQKLEVAGIVLAKDNSSYGGAFMEGFNGITYFGSLGSDNIEFYTGGATKMSITSGGNVLIGTTTDAGYKLYVDGTLGVTNNARISGFLGVGITPDYAIRAYTTNASGARISMEGATNFVCSQFTNTGGSMYFGIDDSAGSNFTGTAYKRFLYSGGGSDFGIYTNGLERFLINGSTGAATFSGQVNIGNPVAAAVAVASTHKVEIVIGGTTYYLLATT